MKKLILFILLTIIYNGVFAQVPAYIPTNGLLALYLFSGNLVDSSSYGNNGAFVGDSAYGTDRFGNGNSCFYADSTAAVSFPVNDFPGGNDGRTVSVFFKLDTPYAFGIRELFAWGNNSAPGGRFGLELVNDTSIGFEATNVHVLCHFNPDTAWHNLTISYPNGGMGTSSINVYIDGEIGTPNSVYAPLDSLSTDTTSGSETIHYAGTLRFLGGSNYTYPWYGYLDDIGVWNRLLTPCEIETMFYGPSPIMPVITGSGMTLSTASTFTGYQWLYNGNLVSGAIANSLSDSVSGAYQVIVTTPGGCVDTSAIYYLWPAGITSVNYSADTKVYPNPSSGVFNIQSPVPVNIVVTDISGQILIKKDNASQLDMSYMPSGIYLMSVFNTQGVKIKTERITYLGD